MKLGRKIRNGIFVSLLVATGLIFISAVGSDFRLGRSMEVLVNAMRELNYFYVEPLDPDKLLKDAAEGMVSSLDPYTAFLPEEEIADFEIMTTGKYGGIGATIRPKGNWIYIAEPYKDSPAAKAGVEIGDKILEIDGRSSQGKLPSEVSSMLKGEAGTSVNVKLEKFDTGKEENLSILRERISISGIPYYGFINDSIAYIQHSDFTEDCSSDMRNALMELRQTGRMKGLILDYRSNGGGILQEAVKILSLFVPKGTEVVSMKGRLRESTASFKTESEPVDTTTPITVLVNSTSASAAEIVAGALQDLDRAVIVGQRTFGKGLVQSTRPVGFNAYMKITTAKYYIPSGRCIQAIDYAHRNEDGSVASVPDSLIREFTTQAGRKVYDGGGIMPDVVLTPEYVSRFTMITYGKGYIDDFAVLYAKKYPTSLIPVEFKLSDKDYEWFVEYMKDKDMEYRSETSTALAFLKQRAERELYIDRISESIDLIEKQLRDDKENNLILYKDQISELIENSLILRHNYRAGVIQHSIASDKDVATASELLSNMTEYTRILTSQDTKKNTAATTES